MGGERHCPNCKTDQPTYQATRKGVVSLRCRTCGFPLENGIVLGAAGAPAQHKILCIDDDPIIRGLLSTVLKQRGFFPMTAQDGTAGLEAARRECPALILLDVMMPGMDGFEVCRRLRDDPQTRDIPVIILTALADAGLNVKAFKAGADLALVKPFEPDRLLNTIQAALALKK